MGVDVRLRAPRGPNAERRQATRDKILAAAVHCLTTDGYAQTSTVRVAAEADVARGSLLHQFPTRVDLILAVADHAARAQGEFIRAGLAKLPPGRERFIGSVDVTWAAFQRPESRALLEIIIATRHDAELAAAHPGLRPALRGRGEPGRAPVRRRQRPARRRRRSRSWPAPDPDGAAGAWPSRPCSAVSRPTRKRSSPCSRASAPSSSTSIGSRTRVCSQGDVGVVI